MHSCKLLVWFLSCCLIGLKEPNAYGQQNAAINKQINKQINNRSERVTLIIGDPSLGETLGLSGYLHGIGSETEGYNGWELVLQNADGSPFTADLSLQLDLNINTTGSVSYSVAVPVVLSSGLSESRTPFLVPFGDLSLQDGRWILVNYRVRISQDGRSLPGLFSELKNHQSITLRTNVNPNQVPVPGLILLSDATVQTRLVVDWQKSAPVVGTANARNVVDAEQLFKNDWGELIASNQWVHPNFGLAVVDRLPTNWLEYSSRSELIVSTQDFAKLDLARLAAIHDYVLAGGTFVVSNCEYESGLDSKLQDWIEQIAPNHPQPMLNQNQDSENAMRFRTIEVGFGSIALSKNDLSFFQQNIFNGLSRSGFSARSASHVMDWYIPHVGQPPVIGFSIFICAFAFLAGPLLLWFAHHRLQRPILLLLVLPPLAITIAGAILLYSVVKDGFETHARVRSATWVNQATSRGVSHSRQTYFSGLPPRQISFSSRSEVWPTPDTLTRRGRSVTPLNIGLNWSSNSQSYSGFLTPRTQCQWTVTTPLDSLPTFDYVITPDTGKLTKIQNVMKDDWILGFFCDKNSKLSSVGPTAAGERGVLSDVVKAKALTDIRKLSQRLAFPPGYPTTGSPSIGAWIVSSYGNEYNSSEVTRNEMERKLEMWLNGGEFLDPGGFILLLRSASYLDQPLRETVRESDSFHVLTGSW
ncbi:MAG: hypothetical protein NTW52_15625 [Planctomycetota bacterium]|nr:hypothetical protein [Planctomycetota bacterium]